MALNTARVSLTVTGNLVQASPNPLIPLAPALNYTKAINLAAGVALKQADRLFIKQDSVSSGSPDTFDLYGALTDPVGDPAVMAKMVGIIVANNSTTAGEILTIGGHATFALLNWVGAANDVIKLGPEGLFVLIDPSLAAYPVASSGADVMQVSVAAGTNVSYDIIIIGRSS